MGKGKAVTAALATRSVLGSRMRVRPYNTSLERQTEGVFTANWWEDLDVVMMALVST